jgi:hypothetical protein
MLTFKNKNTYLSVTILDGTYTLALWTEWY